MHRPDITRIAEQSRAKAAYLAHTPIGYLTLSALAGVYLGFGITLIFSVGAPFAAEGAAAQKLIMGMSFGIALALVIFAGSELFTGNNMVCAHYGDGILAVFHELFGDGIISAIDFKLSIQKIKGSQGEDRVLMIWNGKFLAHIEQTK